MPDQTITSSSYQKLLARIRREITLGQQAIIKQKALTYWKIGKHISKDILKNKSRAGYGEHLYELLEKDLKISADTLRRTVRFYNEYPIWGSIPKLTWTHYEALLRIENKGQRDLLEKKVFDKKLSVSQLKEIIKKKRSPKTSQALDVIPQLSFKRGQLNTYKIIKVKEAVQSTGFSLAVDCGFHEIIPLTDKKLSQFQHDDIIEGASINQIRKSKRSEDDLYTYKAYLIRVVDGDTIWVYVDCGLGRWSHQKLRFRGIDVAEINTAKGKKAKAYIEKIFDSCPFVIIRTYLSDKYDRPLADIFVSSLSSNQEEATNAPRPQGAGATTIKHWDAAKVAAEGKYLNQELLDQALARVW